MRLSWVLVCAIIILRCPLGSQAHMLWLCAVSSAVAVTCMQQHERRSTMCAKLVADCMVHICGVHWARGQVMRQVVRRKAGRLLVVFDCLLVAGWKFPSHPPKGLQGCDDPFVCVCVCVFLGSPLAKGQLNHYAFGRGVDWMGAVGWWRHVKGGSRLPLPPPPPFCPLHFWRVHHYGPPTPNRAAGSRGGTHISRRDCGMVVGMGVLVFLCLSVLQRGNAALHAQQRTSLTW